MSSSNADFLKTFLPDVEFSEFEKMRLEQLETEKEPKSYIQKFKKKNNYRKSDDLNQNCFYCANSFIKYYGTSSGIKRKVKCNILGNTNSNKTDLSRYSVCDLFIKKGL